MFAGWDLYDTALAHMVDVLPGGICMTQLLLTWLMFAGWDVYDTALAHMVDVCRVGSVRHSSCSHGWCLPGEICMTQLLHDKDHIIPKNIGSR